MIIVNTVMAQEVVNEFHCLKYEARRGSTMDMQATAVPSTRAEGSIISKWPEAPKKPPTRRALRLGKRKPIFQLPGIMLCAARP